MLSVLLRISRSFCGYIRNTLFSCVLFGSVIFATVRIICLCFAFVYKVTVIFILFAVFLILLTTSQCTGRKSLQKCSKFHLFIYNYVAAICLLANIQILASPQSYEFICVSRYIHKFTFLAVLADFSRKLRKQIYGCN